MKKLLLGATALATLALFSGVASAHVRWACPASSAERLTIPLNGGVWLRTS